MVVNKIKKNLLLLSLILLCSCNWKAGKENMEIAMFKDFEGAATKCFGRLEMDVSTSTRIRHFEQEIAWLGKIETHPDKSVEEMVRLAEQSRGQLETLYHKTEGARFHDFTQVERGALVSSRESHVAAHQFDLVGYFSIDGVGYVLKGGADDELLELAKQEMVAKSKDIVPLPPEHRRASAGFCIDSGVVHGREFRRERVNVAFTIDRLPDLDLSIMSYSHDGFQGDDLLTRTGRGNDLVRELSSDVSLINLRRGKRMVGGYPGQESVTVMRIPNDKDQFLANWEYQGKPKSVSHPSISLELVYRWSNNEADGAGEPTQEQLLAYWDEVVSSLNLRGTERGIP